MDRLDTLPADGAGTDTLTIRTLEPADLEAGFLETLTQLSEVNLTPEAARAVMKARCQRGVRTFVATSEGRVVGTASLFCEPKFIHAGGWVGHIEDVAVTAEFRRLGVGSRLIERLVGESRAAGCYKVILHCAEALVPFYAPLGFRKANVGMRLDLA